MIQFAPLRSQGANTRAQYIQGQTTLENPPPCSPKAIYSLATAVSCNLCFLCSRGRSTLSIQLEVKGLRKLAFDDIRSKVTPENVVTELFSGFTSWWVSSLVQTVAVITHTPIDNLQAKRYCEDAMWTVVLQI